jgi:fatty acid desaturase
MLRYRADLRTIAFMGVFFALVAVQWLVPAASIFDGGAWWAAAPLFVLTCFFSFFCAVITHNTIHCPVFRSKPLNRAFQVVLTLTYGHPVSTFVPGHNLSHHKFTEGPRDVMRTTKARFRWHPLNGIGFFLLVAPGIVSGERAFVRAMRTQRPRWFQQLLIEAGVLIGVSVLLLVLSWQKFLIWWYLPHLWAAFGIVTMNLLQHDGCDPDSEFNHSRNFVSPFSSLVELQQRLAHHPPRHPGAALEPRARRARREDRAAHPPGAGAEVAARLHRADVPLARQAAHVPWPAGRPARRGP